MELKISDPILVYAPEMTPAVAKWGVYAIPRMWRVPSGELVVRFNGEEDSADIQNIQRAPNLYFVSRDNGESWEFCQNGEELYDISVLTGIDPPYTNLQNGDKVFAMSVKGLHPIVNTCYQKEFISPCRDAELRVYRWGDIPMECKKLCFGRIDAKSGDMEIFETKMDFPEREIHIVSKANSRGEFIKVDEYVHPFIFRLPYFSCICESKSGELLALCCGQNPQVTEKSYTEVYLIRSLDGGKTWQKRATVAGGITDLPYGYGGDGSEISLTMDTRGDLYCVMRMDMSSDPRKDPHPTDTMLCISRDGGYSWSEPRPIADSSVTPHIISISDALLLIYGRPGVHIKYSVDRGESFSEPYSIIGKTLDEERSAGRSDYESKYKAPHSYCNTFWERISENEIIVPYNDLHYPDKNGAATKAAFVRKIKIESEI